MKPERGAPMQLEATGERFVAESPRVQMQVAYEHLHRYLFAQELCRGKTVLDIASGEGYGSNLLAQTAGKVVGIDVSADAVRYARSRYRRENLQFLTGDCSRIPLKSGSVDVVVSFETIEHISAQDRFLSQVVRVLRPDGFLIISSPDKQESTDRTGHLNPFHVAELYRADFLRLLRSRFRNVRPFQQRLVAGSYLAAEDHSSGKVVYGTHRGDLRGGTFNEGVHEGLYIIGVCSNSKLPANIVAGVFENKAESARIWDWYERGAQFREDANELRRKLEEAQQDTAVARRELDDARHEIEAALAKSQALDKEVVARGEWGLRLDGEIEALRKIVADQRAQIEATGNQKDAALAESAALLAGLGASRDEFAREASERGAAVERLQAELEKAGRLVADQHSRIELLSSEAAEERKAAGRLQAELEEAGRTIAAQQVKIGQLETQVAAAAMESGETVGALQRKAEEQQSSAAKRIAELDAAAVILAGELAGARDLADRRILEVGDLRKELARKIAENSQREEEARARIEQLEEDKRVISRDGRYRVALLEREKEEHGIAYSERISRLEAQLAGLEQALAAKARLNDLAEAQILSAQEEISLLLAEAESTLKWASTLDREVIDLRAALAEREAAQQGLTAKVNELFRYSRTLEEELERKVAELSGKAAESGSAVLNG